MDCVNLLIPGEASFNPKKMVEHLEKQLDPLLVTSIKAYVKEEILLKAKGRQKFLATIACNALDITIREYKYGKHFKESEKKQLERLLKRKGTLSSLRSEIASAIQHKDISLGSEGLKQYLRDSTLLQILIDQPNYAGLDELKNPIF